MTPELSALLKRRNGLVTRGLAEQVVPPWAIDDAQRYGELVPVLPGVYRDAATPETPALRRRAALAWLDGRGALSHTTALAVWGLYHPPPGEPVHVTVPDWLRPRPHPGVQLHRRASFLPEPPRIRILDGQPVTPLERSLVDAWPLLPAGARRAPVIQAVGDRMTTPDRVHAVMDAVPDLPGRAELGELLVLLA